MSVVEELLIMLAGMGSGIINAMVGSGTLIIFPALLMTGMSPLAANMVTNIGLAPGSISSAISYRSSVSTPPERVLLLSSVAAVGAVGGAALLLLLPPGVFADAAIVFIGMAIVLMIFQVRLNRIFVTRHTHGAGTSWQLFLSVLMTSVYGAYFGAGQSTILFALMAILMSEGLQEVNALRNVLLAVDNTIAATIYSATIDVDWWPILFTAIGAIIGGQVGVRISQKTSPTLLRCAVVIVGAVGIVLLVTR